MGPWGGGAVCVSDHARDMVHSPVDFAESLHVPVFVSCCPQGPGLWTEWLQDNLVLRLEVEGRVRGGGEGPAPSHFDKTAGNPGA